MYQIKYVEYTVRRYGIKLDHMHASYTKLKIRQRTSVLLHAPLIILSNLELNPLCIYQGILQQCAVRGTRPYKVRLECSRQQITRITWLIDCHDT